MPGLRVLFVLLVVACLQVSASLGRIRLPANPIARNTSGKGKKLQPFARLSSIIPAGAKSGLASAMASAVVKITLQPFDTIKTIQQMDQKNLGFLRTTAAFVKERGVRALWSGTGLAVVGSAPAVAAYFGIYNAAKVRLVGVLPKPMAVAVSATIANTAASFLRAPYEVLKTRMQVGRHPTIYSALRHSLTDEGVLGLFGTGKLAVQIARDVPYAIIIAVSYELLQETINRYRVKMSGSSNSGSGKVSGSKESGGSVGSSSGVKGSNKDKSSIHTITTTSTTTTHTTPVKRNKHAKTIQDALCGSVAGGISTLLTTPMDVVKTRLMGGDRGIYEYTSVSNAVCRMWAEEGPKAFFIGTSGRLLHKIPANGLFYIFYEAFRSLLGVSEQY